MKKLYYFVIITLFSVMNSEAQNSQDNVRQAVVDIYSQLLVYPQEKIYIQTDKPYYLNGEKMYFRAFLLHASTLKSMNASRYVYVELLSPMNTVAVRRQIIVQDDQMFYGSLSLAEDLPEGNYTLRAYTRYMENLGEEWFYSKSVFIADPNATKAKLQTKFEYLNDNQVGVSINLKKEDIENHLKPHEINILLGGDAKQITTKVDTNGLVYEKIKLKANDTERTILLDYKNDYNSFSKYIYIPYPTDILDLTFYPEGGNLIAGQKNKIAFKALLQTAKPANVKGSIFNSSGQLITSFETQHEGMGVTSFTPELGEKYYAEYIYNDQVLKKDLPDAKASGYALQTIWEKDSLSISVCASSDVSQNRLYLLLHRQGVPVLFEEWNPTAKNKKIASDNVASGVTHLLLLTDDFRPVSERLVFNYTNQDAKIELTPNKSAYRTREHVACDIQINGIPEDSIPPSFAISITDDKDIKIDTTTNIIAEMYLVSELKGNINNPSWYFSNDPKAKECADLLMLTHGWRRYNVEEALAANLQRPNIKPESDYSFTGILKDLRGKPYKKAKIRMSAVGFGYSDVAESDDNGRFLFNNFEFPDSTAYQFVSYTNKNTNDIEVILDKIQYPALDKSREKYAQIDNDEFSDENFIAFATKADIKYTQENGIRKIFLPEVTVKTRNNKEGKKYNNNISLTNAIKSDRWVSADELKEMPSASFDELFSRLGSITVSEGTSIVLNGVVYRYEDLSSIVHINDIAQVEVYRNLVLANTLGCDNPVIALTTWPPGEAAFERRTNSNIQLVLPLGYQQPAEFYSPKYDTSKAINNQTPDLRNTIYWKPNVIVDGNNRASVSFYTADSPTTYSVIIEGVTNTKKLIYYKKDAFINVVK